MSIARSTPALFVAYTVLLSGPSTGANHVRTGGSLTGMLGVYLLTLPGMTLLIVILLYLISVVVGRIALGAFARAVAPAQIVAVSTRSSVAALPALVEGGRKHMRLPETARDFVLPLSVSLFRVSHVISNPVKLVFLAHVYGISLQPAAVALFLITVIIFSFSSTGTPNSGGGGSFRMLPVFLAAGIPTEGVIIIEAVETIPDIFDTLVNVTGQMSAITILSRASRPGREPMSASECVTSLNRFASRSWTSGRSCSGVLHPSALASIS